MHITLIATRHENLGKCNSEELLEILNRILPEVIFEEIPPVLFDEYYVEKGRRNLETDGIKLYVQGRKIKQIPVDINDLPSDDFFNSHKNLLRRIEGLTDQNGFDFRTMTDLNNSHIRSYGFDYLNSSECDRVNDIIKNAIENGLIKIGDEGLFHAYSLWNEVNEKRENHMLNKIYKYSINNDYDKAVFTIGAAHRKSITKKIATYINNQELEISWRFYNTST